MLLKSKYTKPSVDAYISFAHTTAEYSKKKGRNINCLTTRLRAGRPMNRGSIPGMPKRLFSSPKRPDDFPGTKAVNAWSWPLTSI
jgi:hypothetical protein